MPQMPRVMIGNGARRGPHTLRISRGRAPPAAAGALAERDADLERRVAVLRVEHDVGAGLAGAHLHGRAVLAMRAGRGAALAEVGRVVVAEEGVAASGEGQRGEEERGSDDWAHENVRWKVGRRHGDSAA